MTSLAKQLLSLKKSYENIENGVLERFSLIHDANSVKKISRESSLNNSVAALEELILINKNFTKYKNSLFSKNSINLTRGNMTQAENLAISKEIHEFLYLISPYLLLSCSHSVLEWLVFKYSINVHESEIFFFSFLHYHETKIFARAIMLINSESKSQFHWLSPLQKEGIPLSRLLLLDKCRQNKWIIVKYSEFIKNMSNFLICNGEDGGTHSLIYSFFASLILHFFDSYEESLNQIVDQILPSLINALDSTILNNLYSYLLILNKIVRMVIIQPDRIEMIFNKLLQCETRDSKIYFSTILNIIESQGISELNQDFLNWILSLPNLEECISSLTNPNSCKKLIQMVLYITLESYNELKIQKISQKVISFIESSLVIQNIDYFFTSALLEYLSKEGTNTQQFCKFLECLISKNITLVNYIESHNPSKPVTDLLASIKSKTINKNAVDIDIKSFMKKLKKSYSMKVKIAENDLNSSYSHLFTTSPLQLVPLISIKPKVLKYNLNHEALQHIQNIVIGFMCNNPLMFYQYLENDSIKAKRARIIQFIFANNYSTFQILPYLIKEYFSSEERYLFKTLECCPEILQIFQEPHNDSVSLLSSLDIVIDDNFIVFLNNTQDTKVIITLVVAVVLQSNKIPTSLSFLTFLTKKLVQVSTKANGDRMLDITEVNINEIFNSCILSSQDRFKEILLWSVYTLISYYSLPNNLNEICLTMQALSLILYLKHTISEIRQEIRRILIWCINNKLSSPSVILEVLTKILVDTTNTALIESNYIENIVCYVKFLEDLLKSSVFKSLDISCLLLPLICLCNHSDLVIRNTSLDFMYVLSKQDLKTETLDILKDILHTKTTITNDHTSILNLMVRLIKKGSRNSDFLIDTMIDSLKIINVSPINIFSLKCVNFLKNHPDLLTIIHSYVKQATTNPLNEPFFSCLSYYFTQLKPEIVKSPLFFETISIWSVSNIKASNQYLCEMIIPKIDQKLYSMLDKHQQVELISIWLDKINQSDSKLSLILKLKISGMTVDSTVFKTKLQSIYMEVSQENCLNERINLIETIFDIVSRQTSFTDQQVILPTLLEFTELLSTKKCKSTLNMCLESILAIFENISSKSSLILSSNLNLKHLVNILRNKLSNSSVDLCLKIFQVCSRISPKYLLDYLMPLFTFMGSYSVKRDDDESLNNISRTIQVIIPAMSSHMLNDSENICKIVDTFTSAFIYVPKHRHEILFENVIRSLPSKNALGIVVVSLFGQIEQISEFIDSSASLFSRFTVCQQLSAILYVFNEIIPEIGSIEHSSIGFKRKQSCEITLDRKLHSTLELFQSIISTDEFKDSLLMIPVENIEEFNQIFQSILELYFEKLYEFRHHQNGDIIDKTLNLFYGYGDQMIFLESIKQYLTSSNPTYCIIILYQWTASNCHLQYNVSNIFNEISEILLSYIINHKSLNTLNCKKCLFIIKNLMIKIENNSITTKLFSELVDLYQNICENLSLSISLILILSQTFEILHDPHLFLPKLIPIISFTHSSLTNTTHHHFNEILISSLYSIINHSYKYCDEYLIEVFGILYSTPQDKCRFNDFENIFLVKNSTKYDRNIFELINLLATKINTDILLNRLCEFFKQHILIYSSSFTYITYLIHLHILRSSSTVIESYKSDYLTMFSLFMDYRNLCSQRGTKFHDEIEISVILLFQRVSLKLTESAFSEFYAHLYSLSTESAANCFNNHRLITFYRTTFYLFDKFGSIVLPFFVHVLDTFLSSIQQVIRQFDEISSCTEDGTLPILLTLLCKCLSNNTSNQISSNHLLSVSDHLIQLLKLCNESHSFVYDYVIPSFGILTISLAHHDLIHELIKKLVSLVNNKSPFIRDCVANSFISILNTAPDQSVLIIPQITSSIEILQKDESSKVQQSTQRLVQLINTFNDSQ